MKKNLTLLMSFILTASTLVSCGSDLPEKDLLPYNPSEKEDIDPEDEPDIEVPLNDEIQLLSPVDSMDMSLFVASFKANSELSGPFHLQVSPNKNFKEKVIEVETTSIGSDSKNIYFFQDGKNKLTNLGKGTWYWRVTDDANYNNTNKEEQEWSSRRVVFINDNKTTTPVGREINNKKPFFHARLRSNICTKPDALARVQALIPDDLKDVLILDHPTTWPYFLEGNTVIDYYRKVNDLGYPFTMDLGRPDGANHEKQGDRAVTLGEVEYVFQNFENCVGITSGELFYMYFYDDQLGKIFTDGALDLAAKYGKYFMLSDMNWRWNKWSMYSFQNYDRFKNNGLGKYFIPLYKTTDPWGALVCMSAIQGMGVTGMVDNYGIWSDMWCWEKFGDPGQYYTGTGQEQKKFPYIFNMKAFLLSISQGGTVTALEPALAWGDGANPNENYTKYLIPFLRGVYEHNIMIDKQVMINSCKAIVDLDLDPASVDITYSGDFYGDLYRSTYGIWEGGVDPSKQEIIPNSSRYGIIPFLPHPSCPTPAGMSKYAISSIQTKDQAESTLGKLYPAQDPDNEAYTIDLDNTIVVLNTQENEDVAQKYVMQLGTSGIKSMSGDINLMNYIMGKRSGNSYWFQTNGQTKGSNTGGIYDIDAYNTTIQFVCDSEPTVVVEQTSEVVESSWNSATKTLTLELKHNNGAVNFTISL